MRLHKLALVSLAGLGALALGARPSPASDPVPSRGHGVTHEVRSGATGVETASPRLRRTRRAPFRNEAVRTLREERAGPSKVFGHDDREPVYDTEAYPWSAVAKVYARFPDGRWAQGSGVLVGPSQALTAAHLVYDEGRGGWADRLEVIPGFDLGYEPFGVHEAERMRTFVGWTDYHDYDYDIALVDLDSDVGDTTGWLGIAAEDDRSLLDSTLNTAGYPVDLDDGQGMWFAYGFADSVQPARIRFSGELDSFAGQSGSAVWTRDGDDRFVVGVMSHETFFDNVATRISGDVFDTLDGWLQGLAGFADFAVTAVGSDIPAVVTGNTRAVVSVDVANDGDVAATVAVDVFAEHASGQIVDLASGAVALGVGQAGGLDFDVIVPATIPAGDYTLFASVNADGAVAESDLTDNELAGPGFRVPASWESIPLGETVRGRLAPGGEARYRFVVDRNARLLKLRLTGLRFGFAIVERPDGSTFTLFPGRRNRVREPLPLRGEWRVVAENPPDSFKSRAVRFKAKLSRR